MRRQFVYILLFFWGFHFLFPFVFQYLFGEITIYSDINSRIGFVINSVVCFVVIFFLYTIKIPSFIKISPIFNYVWVYYLLACVLTLLKFTLYGGFEGQITGAANGSIISFLTIPFNLKFAIFFLFMFQKKIKYISGCIISYILLTTIMGSRSAIISVLILLLYLPLYSNSSVLMPKLKRAFLVLCFFAPLLFIYATSVRTEIDMNGISKLIVGRISMIELSSIPLETKDDQSYDTKLFSDKYSISNQLEQSMNVITPIDLFQNDVNPNQYYRSIFLGYSEEFVQNVYMSMNLTFPIYWILISNYFWGVLLASALLLLYFFLLVRSRNNIFLFTILLCSLYEILYFFDLVMITQNMFRMFVSIIALYIVEKLCSMVVYTCKKYVRI